MRRRARPRRATRSAARVDFGGRRGRASARTGRAGQGFSLRRGVAALARRRRGRDHARRPAVHHAAGDHGRARRSWRATTPSARSTTARPGHPVVLVAARAGRRRRARGRRGRARAAGALPGPQVGGGPPGQRDRHRHARGAVARMKLELGFDVAAPIDAVWPALNDLESVAPCLPGATITGREDGTYHGRVHAARRPVRGGAPGHGPDRGGRRGRARAAAVRRECFGQRLRRDDRQHALRDRRRDARRRRRRSDGRRGARRLRRQRRDRGRRQPPAARLRHLPGRAPERAADADGRRRHGRQGRARGTAGRGSGPPDPEGTGG